MRINGPQDNTKLGRLGRRDGALAAFPAARAQESKAFPAPVLKKADPHEKADGTLSPAAKAAIVHGPLPFSDADVAAKAAADRERDEAESSHVTFRRPFSRPA
jgi:hypothetical protein